MHVRTFILLVSLSVCTAIPAFATDYYVSTAGSDANAGTSPANAWHTLARVNRAALAAGDRVLLQGGAVFDGKLVIDTHDGGTLAAPLTVTSYGTGRATVRAATGNAILVHNRAAVRLARINVVGARASGSSGIVLYSDAPAAAPLGYARLEDLDVSGFAQDGISVGAWNGGAGFSDVTIMRVTVHDNGRTGILTYADRPNVHRRVYVGYSAAYNISGIAGASANTGSGIVLGAVNGGAIERCVAHDNGSLNTAPQGPIGIWAYDSTSIVIQHNESFRNHTGGPTDGGGFDLDQNVADSVVQFNYSHNNDGAGYLLAHAYATSAHRSNTIRFNISQDDGRKNGYGGIEVWGRTIDAAIEHNTVVMSAAETGTPAAVRVHNLGIPGIRARNVRVLNNILYTRAVLPLISISRDELAAAPLIVAGNVYYSTSGFEIEWGSSTFASLKGFRIGTGQEQIAGVATGMHTNPGLRRADGGSAIGDPMLLGTLSAYRLSASSPVRGRGVALSTFGLDAGVADFYGTPLDGETAADPGAHQSTAASSITSPPAEVVISAAASPWLTGNWAIVPDPAASGGARVQNPNRGAARVTTPAAVPRDYFELTFDAQAGVPYRLWIRGRAERDSYDNDSVYAQFSDAVDAAGNAVFRIGTTGATTIVLEDCSGCGVAGWGWQDNGYGLGVLGPAIYFATTGTHTIRFQPREDGLGIDQVVLAPSKYLSLAPGAAKNDNITLAPTSDDGLAPPSDAGLALAIAGWTAPTRYEILPR